MTDKLPPPMSPPDCDLRGYDYMPLFGHRLFTSSLYTSSTGDEFRTAVRIWWSAWQQKPAGSLPDNDPELAMLSDYGRDLKGWLRVKATVLRGFILCADGRLYHPMLCEEAVKAYEFRLKKDEKRKQDRERLAVWRDTKKKRDDGPPGNTDGSGGKNADGTADVTPKATPAEAQAETQSVTRDDERCEDRDETYVETRFIAAMETRNETSNVEVDNTTQYKTEKSKEESTPKPPRVSGSDEDDDFAEFWREYPRKDDKGHARKAWVAACKKAPASAIIAGCKAYTFSETPKYRPLPATWLNGERWLQAEDTDGMDPVLRAAGVTQADLDKLFGNTDEQTQNPTLRLLQ